MALFGDACDLSSTINMSKCIFFINQNYLILFKYLNLGILITQLIIKKNICINYDICLEYLCFSLYHFVYCLLFIVYLFYRCPQTIRYA